MLEIFSKHLRQHFVRATVIRKFSFVENEIVARKVDNPERIDPREPYQPFIFEDRPSGSSAEDVQKLAPVFAKFCEDGQRLMESSEVEESTKQKISCVLEDYLVMRRAAREEAHILELNRVGLEKDEAKIRENVAKHCGLEIPKKKNL